MEANEDGTSREVIDPKEVRDLEAESVWFFSIVCVAMCTNGQFAEARL